MSRKESPGARHTGAAIVVCVLTLVANVASGSAACGVENAGCARAGASRLWLGRVLTEAGQPLAGAEVEYYFASGQPSGSPLEKPLVAVSDAEGRYCVRWPAETALAYVAVRVPSEQAVVLVSPDASAYPGASYLIANSGQRDLTVTSRGWDATADVTGHCVSASPAWYRVDDVKSNWRYRLLLYLPLLGLVLTVAGILARRRGVPAVGRWAASGGTAVATAGAVLYVLVWLTHSI
jgi:hypothetical protein